MVRDYCKEVQIKDVPKESVAFWHLDLFHKWFDSNSNWYHWILAEDSAEVNYHLFPSLNIHVILDQEKGNRLVNHRSMRNLQLSKYREGSEYLFIGNYSKQLILVSAASFENSQDIARHLISPINKVRLCHPDINQENNSEASFFKRVSSIILGHPGAEFDPMI